MSENKENEKLTFDREKGGKWIGCRVNKIRSRFVARNDLHEIYLSIVAIWSFKILQLIIKIVIVVFVLDSVQVTILILFLPINIHKDKDSYNYFILLYQG